MATLWVTGQALWIVFGGISSHWASIAPHACVVPPKADIHLLLRQLEREPIWGVFFRPVRAAADGRLALAQKTAEPPPVLVETLPRSRMPVKPAAHFPELFKRENGRLVCSVNHDKPHKSRRGKGRHMDMECCLDPDETPNPNCYYSPEKYGHLLKRFL